MKNLLRLLILFRPYWGWAAAGIAVSLISLLANIILLSLSGWFITTMALAGVTGMAVNYFTPAAIIRACAILRTGGRYLERLITHEATFRFMAEMRSWLYQRIEAMPLSQSSQYHSGDLLARLRGDIDALESFYINIVIPSCVAFLALLIIIPVFAIYSPALSLVQFSLLVLSGVIIPFIAFKKGKNSARQIVEQKSDLKKQMVDNLQSFAEMTVYGVAQHRMNMALQTSNKLIEDQKILGIMDGVAQGANNFLANIALWSALVFSLYLYQQGQINQAHIPMLSLLALASFEAVLPLAIAFQSLEGSLQAARRIFALDIFQHVPKVTEAKKMPDSFNLAMENIYFSYPERPPVLDNFSLHLKTGSITPLIGPSGMGKSSVIHLLTRSYKPDHGKITLNGHGYHEYSEDEIRQYFSVVPQRPYLFIGTLRTNLLLARPDATEKDLDHACWIAGLEEMIAKLPKGYDTYLGEGGATLSGGEIKRLAIARAVLKNAPCLLLDEIIEGLDAETTILVKNRLFSFAKDKAVLTITHEKIEG